jgi:hypothetical protein
VGLIVLTTGIGIGIKACIPPDQGPAHGQKIAHALTVGCGTYDADRSDLDETDVAARVLEHLRPLDARGLSDVRRGDLDRLAARADAMRARAPFAAQAPAGRSARDRMLRRYMACYGIESPARGEAERRDVAAAIVEALAHVARAKPRASLVHVLASAPPEAQAGRLPEVLRRLSRQAAAVTWSLPDVEPALKPPWDAPRLPESDPDEEPAIAPKDGPFQEVAPLAAEAVTVRARVAQTRREAALRKLGVRVVRIRPVPQQHAPQQEEPHPRAPQQRGPEAATREGAGT